MPYLVLGIALLVGLVLLAKGFAGADPRTLARIIKWSGGILGVAVLVLLVITGRFGVAIWASMLLLPLILRWRQFQNMARGWRGPSPGQTSEVETPFLRMTLDHDTGELSGIVLEGVFRGRRLEELGMHELVELLRECRIHDAQGAAILETYLDRMWSGEWRGGQQGAGAGGGYHRGAGAGSGYHGGASSGGHRRPGGASGGMSREEAYQVLGLAPGATPEEIKEAHRRLMLRYHPDHGGSTYLAAKINEAKDLLLRW